MSIDPRPAYPDIIDTLFWDCWFQCNEATLLSVERLYALYSSVRHVVKKGIPGVFCECGVYRGGASCFCATALKKLGNTTMDFYLFDTFCGFPKGVDAESISGESFQDFPKIMAIPRVRDEPWTPILKEKIIPPC